MKRLNKEVIRDMENLIKDNKERFMTDLPDRHRERFAMKMQESYVKKNKVRRLWLGVSSAAAAALFIFLMIDGQDAMQPYIYNENEKVAEMRMLYETQLNETILLLEDVLKNVDDSTKNEINKAIENLTSTAEVFAEIAPLPEEKQLAITSQIYGTQLQTLNSIYRKINKK